MQGISAMSVQKICDRGGSWNDHTKIYHTRSNKIRSKSIEGESTNAMQATAPIQGMLYVVPTRSYKSWLSIWSLQLFLKGDHLTSPSCITENTKKHCPNKKKAELRFINTLIAPGQPNYSPVCQRTRYAHRKNDANQAPKIS